jgi:hypothetical protein
MNWTTITRRVLAPAFVIGISGASLAACGEDGIGGLTDALCCEDFKPGSNMVAVDWGLEGDANLKFGIFMQAIGDLSISASGVITAVGVECEAMAKEMDAPAPTLSTAEAGDPATHAQAWCGVAFQAIADLKASASLSIEFEGPRCEVEASAQANCEASCQVDASCQEPSLEARCEGGELSGKCEAECTGKCEGSASVAVTCEGSCSGTCRGDCSAGCEATDSQGNCAGKCEGTCEGKCEGTCEAEAGAEVECEGTCTGECSVEFKAPKCSAELTPPSCEADAECSGGCDASASAKAECHPPSLTITGDFEGDFELEAKVNAIKVHLPNLVAQLLGKVNLLSGNVTAIGNAAVEISGDLTLTAGLCILPAIAAMEDAAVNLTASANIAADLTAKVGGG